MSAGPAGSAKRRAVLGDNYVEGAHAAARSPASCAFQQLITDFCWEGVWCRQSLDDRERSLLCLGMMIALGREFELERHVEGALRNGLSVDQVEEAILFSTPYCGIPAALDAFRIAQRTIRAAGKGGGVG